MSKAVSTLIIRILMRYENTETAKNFRTLPPFLNVK